MKHLILILLFTISCARNTSIDLPLPTAKSFIEQLQKPTFYLVASDTYWGNSVEEGIEIVIKEKDWALDDGSKGKLVIIWISDADLLANTEKLNVSNVYDDGIENTTISYTWCQSKGFLICQDTLNTFETIEGTRYSHGEQLGLFQKFFKVNKFSDLGTKFKFK